MIRSVKGKAPRIDPDAVVMETAVLTGDVEVGADASIWCGAAVRGDLGSIRIGARSSIQDNCVVHCSAGGSVVVGDEVTVGHGAILHGCHLKRRCLVGMGAIVLDGAVVGENAMVGAGSLVTGGTIVPDGHLALGSPAKVKRPLTPEELKSLEDSAAHYVELSKEYREGR
jgi:carbonic anhydrase/acetyltransferase-like protein (isoleucine patch superfamily)